MVTVETCLVLVRPREDKVSQPRQHLSFCPHLLLTVIRSNKNNGRDRCRPARWPLAPPPLRLSVVVVTPEVPVELQTPWERSLCDALNGRYARLLRPGGATLQRDEEEKNQVP